MSYLHRVTPNKATSQNIEAIYNEKADAGCKYKRGTGAGAD